MLRRVNLALSNVRRRIEEDRALVRRIKRALLWIGYDATQIVRVVPYAVCFKWVEALNPQSLDVLEIGSGEVWGSRFSFKSYTTLDYPEHDICRDRIEREFDLVIADNVFEHLAWPYRAARNVFAMVKPGGWFLALTPFLIRIHDVPIDCTRWTETGMRYFLSEAGFDPATMQSGSWGNRKAVIANFRKLGAYRGWARKLPNEPQFPATVWVMAQRPAAHPD
jgi:SAM-dependent methyltransferase